MSNKGLRLAMMHAAIMAAAAQDDYFMMGRGRVVENKESPEDRARRERCEQMSIEKAKAKRERKAAKRRKDNE